MSKGLLKEAWFTLGHRKKITVKLFFSDVSTGPSPGISLPWMIGSYPPLDIQLGMALQTNIWLIGANVTGALPDVACISLCCGHD